MIVVLDVSAAVQILLQKEKKDQFASHFHEASWVIAPDLFVSQISNVLWKYHRAGAVTHDECIQLVEDGISMIDDFVEAKELWKEALSEGIKNNSAIYDMFYVVLARRNDAKLITNDGALAALCKKLRIAVVS